MSKPAKRTRSEDPFVIEIRRAIAALVQKGGTDEKGSLAKIAADAGCSAAELYQWRSGIRPVPPERAEALARALQSTPEKISPRYAGFPAGERSREQVDEAELQSLKVAISLLSSVMAVHRPIEAKDAASAIRTAPNIPPRLLKKGSFLQELIRTLDGETD